MQVTPISMIGNTDVFSQTFKRIRLHNGDGEGKRTVCSGYDTPVPLALLQVILGCFYSYLRKMEHFAVLLYRTQIGRRNIGWLH